MTEEILTTQADTPEISTVNYVVKIQPSLPPPPPPPKKEKQSETESQRVREIKNRNSSKKVIAK